MAATFLDSWKLANFVDNTETPHATDFRRRVQSASVKVAKLVGGEAQATMTREQWQKRAALANNVLGTQIVGDPPVPTAGSAIWLDTFANAVAQNPSITETSSDGDIEFEVTASWDDIAGVTGADLNLAAP